MCFFLLLLSFIILVSLFWHMYDLNEMRIVIVERTRAELHSGKQQTHYARLQDSHFFLRPHAACLMPLCFLALAGSSWIWICKIKMSLKSKVWSLIIQPLRDRFASASCQWLWTASEEGQAFCVGSSQGAGKARANQLTRCRVGLCAHMPSTVQTFLSSSWILMRMRTILGILVW